jgi:rhomboid protease GluP
MTIEERMAYCKVCDNKAFSPDKGLICKLTQEKADFDDTCPDFSGVPPELKPNSQLPSEEDGLSLNNLKLYFIPSAEFFATPILLLICVFTFAILSILGVSVFVPTFEDLVHWGGNVKFLVLEGEYWRLITANFLHVGLFHLAFNMYALLYVGLLLEPIIGKYKVFLAYIVTGVIGAIVSLWWTDVLIVSVGASGAIFGLYGVFVALLTTNLLSIENRKGSLVSIGIFIVYNLLYGMKEGIDNASHVGGLVSGLALGYAYFPAIVSEKAGKKSFSSVLIGVSIILVGGYYLLINSSNAFGTYVSLFDEFVETETKALEFYSLDLKEDEKVTFIQETAIPSFVKCKELVEKMDAIPKLQGDFKEVVHWLGVYVKTHLFIFELTQKSIEEETMRYYSTIERHQENVEKILKKIDGEPVQPKNIPFMVEFDSDDFLKLNSKTGQLIFVNGRKIKSLDQLDPESIDFIEEVAPEKAVDIYGKAGKNGVLIVTLKK